MAAFRFRSGETVSVENFTHGMAGVVRQMRSTVDSGNEYLVTVTDPNGHERTQWVNELDMERYKSLKQGTKTMTDTHAPDAALETYETKQEPPAEKLGAQVLRRLHEDGKALMEQYHGMHGLLEEKDVSDYLQGHLEGIEKHLTAVEKMFAKKYKDLPGLEDAMDLEEEEETKAADPDAEKPVESADSGAAELPTPEEAVEGMRKEPEEKALPGGGPPYSAKNDPKSGGWIIVDRDGNDVLAEAGGHWENRADAQRMAEKYNSQSGHGGNGAKALRNGKGKSIKAKTKSMCPECGKEGCTCGEKGIKGREPGDLADADDDERRAAFAQMYHGDNKSIREAKAFLKAIGEDGSEFGEEQKMMAYHYAKMLTKAEPGSPEWEAEEAAEPQHHTKMWPRQQMVDFLRKLAWSEADLAKYSDEELWKAVRAEPGAMMQPAQKPDTTNAAKFLKAMAFEKAFGMAHRAKALALVKELEEAEEKADTLTASPQEIAENLRKQYATLAETIGIANNYLYGSSGATAEKWAQVLNILNSMDKAFHKDEPIEEPVYEPGQIEEKRLQKSLETQNRNIDCLTKKLEQLAALVN